MRITTGTILLAAFGYLWYQERTIQRLRTELGRREGQQVTACGWDQQ